MLKRIKMSIIGLTKTILLIDFYENKKYIKELISNIEEARKANKKCVFITNTPEHGNLGDHAITLAEKQFIQKYDDKCMIMEIPTKRFKRNLKKFKPLVNDKDCFIINGGGFVGTLWMM